MPASDVEELLEAADAVGSEREAKAVLNALCHTPGLTECPIAPDVLAKLLPDEGVVVLPRLRRVGGGALYRLVKRAFDVCFSACVLVCLSWLFLIVASARRRW